jgi:hypothetical protein
VKCTSNCSEARKNLDKYLKSTDNVAIYFASLAVTVEDQQVNDKGDEAQWLAVIGRSLAFLCLQQEDLRNKDLLEKADFLEALGITRADVAAMLGVKPDSLTQARWRATGGKGRKRAKATKKR